MYGALARTSKSTLSDRRFGQKRIGRSDYHAHPLAYTPVFGSSHVKIGSDLTVFNFRGFASPVPHAGNRLAFARGSQ